jgi:hypothetical protein
MGGLVSKLDGFRDGVFGREGGSDDPGFFIRVPFFLRHCVTIIACARISVYDTQPVAGPSTPNAPYLKNDIRSAVYMVPNIHCLEVLSRSTRPCFLLQAALRAWA